MSTVELKKLKTALPGESAGAIARRAELGLGNLDIQNQSVVLKEDANIHVNSLISDGKLITNYYEDVKTLYDVFQRGLKISRDAPCLGWRPGPEQPYKWLTYEQVHLRAQYFGSGLIKHGISAGQDTTIGLYSLNRIGWVIAEQAANMYSMVIVPLYDTLGPDACKFICNQAELKTIICDTEKRANILLDEAENIPSFRKLIMMEKPSDEIMQKATDKKISVHKFAGVEEDGQNDLQKAVPPSAEDLSTICYTSGTTGNPKGAMLTHGNFVACISGFLATTTDSFELRTGDVYISYLPLAHVYERFAQAGLLMHGARIGFYQGDPKLLLDDVQALRPTFFACVPRVMNKIYDKVLANVAESSGLKRKLFKKAMNAKKNELQKGIVRNNGFWDIILKRARNVTGGNVRIISTGAAPISPEVKLFFRSIFGCVVVEGYGQTETTTVTAFTSVRDLSEGHVGAILPCIQVKLIDVPDLNYVASEGQGEVCVKGGSVFKGYFKDEEKTRETIDKDGYLHSGDVGEFLPNGQLKIIDRVKHIFKLSQGEYIAPEKVENEYVRTEGVAQIYVHGDSLKDCCVGIVFPDEEWLQKLATNNGWEGGAADWCAKKELKEIIFDKLNQTAKLAKLKGFEQVKNIHINHEIMTTENGLLTPTFKLKRPIAKKQFSDILAALYMELTDRQKTTAEKKSADAAAKNGSAPAANGKIEETDTMKEKKAEDNANEEREENKENGAEVKNKDEDAKEGNGDKDDKGNEEDKTQDMPEVDNSKDDSENKQSEIFNETKNDDSEPAKEEDNSKSAGDNVGGSGGTE